CLRSPRTGRRRHHPPETGARRETASLPPSACEGCGHPRHRARRTGVPVSALLRCCPPVLLAANFAVLSVGHGARCSVLASKVFPSAEKKVQGSAQLSAAV